MSLSTGSHIRSEQTEPQRNTMATLWQQQGRESHRIHQLRLLCELGNSPFDQH